MLSYEYQNLPQIIDPIAFSVGSFSIRWYSLMYLAGFLVILSLLKLRKNRKETELRWEDILDFLMYAFLGSLIGGRLGYVLFYNLSYYLDNPIEIILPIRITDYGLRFAGFYGMSYFGAVLGIFFVAWIFSKKRRVDIFNISDFVLPAVPLGYFFGRIGNFLNGELYGRATEGRWGMYFSDGQLRHPSQFYEAFFEGIVLFFILWSLRNKLSDKKGALTGIYLAGYGLFRFFIEFFREPDKQLGFILGFLTLGQIFAIFLFFIGAFIVRKSGAFR